MTPSTVSALCITQTSLSLGVVNTCAPLPCAPAFPGSLAGRYSRDYYGHSVTLGLAPCR